MNMEKFKEIYEELKNNPMYQKYCSVLETKDKVIKKLVNQLEKLTQENNDLEERVIHQDNVIKQLNDKINEKVQDNK